MKVSFQKHIGDAERTEGEVVGYATLDHRVVAIVRIADKLATVRLEDLTVL